jgi:uncharacterized coiled-coil protein SlyX
LEVCAVVHYWYVVIFQKAFWDSVHFVDKSGEGLIYDILVLALTGLWLWKKNKDQPMNLKKFRGLLGEGTIIAIVAFLLVWAGKVIWTPYGMQSETVQALDASKKTERQATDRVGQLEVSVTTKDAKIDSVNAQLTTTFTQLSKSQGVINSLAAQVTKANQPEPLEMTPIGMGSLYPDLSKGLRTGSILVLSNRTIAPVKGIFMCENAIKNVNAVIAGVGIVSSTEPSRVAFNAFQIEIDSPAWSPKSPLLVTVYFDEPELGKCGLR